MPCNETVHLLRKMDFLAVHLPMDNHEDQQMDLSSSSLLLGLQHQKDCRCSSFNKYTVKVTVINGVIVQ